MHKMGKLLTLARFASTPESRAKQRDTKMHRRDALRILPHSTCYDRALEFQSAKELRVRSHDDGGETHGDRANTHGQIESPTDKKPCCDRYGDKVINGRPN